MSRLEGTKKSPVPLILGLLVLAALIAGAYSLLARGNSPEPAANVAATSPSMTGSADNNAAANSTTENTATDTNSATGTNTAIDTNSAVDNSANTATDANVAADSAIANTPATNANSVADQGAGVDTANSAATNSATGTNSAMDNSATSSNAATGNSAAATGIGTTTQESNKPGAIIAREKTIKSGQATITYRKEMQPGGGEKRSVTTSNTASNKTP